MQTTFCDSIVAPWSPITLGCWQIAPSEGWGDMCSAEDADSVVKTALDFGITAFDTAEGYGDGESERRLGKALGHKKYDVVVISKLWPDAALTSTAYQERLDHSLRALNRDYVDVYLIHWPGSYFDSPYKSEKLCELMFRLNISGKAKTVGLSNFKSHDLELLGERISRFSVNQVPYSLLDRRYEDQTLNHCQNSGIPYMAYSPTGQGLLCGRLDEPSRQAPPTRQNNPFFQSRLFSQSKKLYDAVCAIAAELHRKPVEVALAWVLAQPNILTAIVGSRKPAQVQEFSGAMNLQLSSQHLIKLTAASDLFQKTLSATY